MENLEFKVKLSIADLYYFMMYHYYTMPAGLFGIILSIGAALMLAVRYSTLSVNGKLLLFIVAITFTILNPVSMWMKSANQIKHNKSLSDELTYVLGKEAITVKQGEEHADIPWSQIARVKDNGRELVVYVTNSRGYIWPKAQIQAEYEWILARLEQHVEARRLKLKK